MYDDDEIKHAGNIARGLEDTWIMLTRTALEVCPSNIKDKLWFQLNKVLTEIRQGKVIQNPIGYHAGVVRNVSERSQTYSKPRPEGVSVERGSGMTGIMGALAPGSPYKPMPKEFVTSLDAQDREFWIEWRGKLRDEINELLTNWGLFKEMSKTSTTKQIQDWCKYCEQFCIVTKWLVWERPFTKEILLKQSSGDSDVIPLGNSQGGPSEYIHTSVDI